MILLNCIQSVVKKLLLLLLLLLQLSCKKEHESLGPVTPPNTPSNQSTVNDTSFIHVAVNQISMDVKTIYYDRGSSTVHLMAANGLQKVEVNTFHFWGTSGLNYQYQDSITYAYRRDTLSQWQVVRAPYNTSGVMYDCCALPTKDSPVKGTFKADFGVESNLFIDCIFHLIFK